MEPTDRELEVLALIARGLTVDEVAAELWLSRHTVVTHQRNAVRKLEARSRAHAVALAIGRGLILPPS